ncbi:hypothetical protein M0802_009674 [Mischocyttarus mexicanus]|nr:hypothetical protein M0802_009674 [Mischocyttarus mexicanus]
MNLDYDVRERVSNLANAGKKICSELRNFQKERIILSREAKCLLNKFEKEEIQRDCNKTKKSESKPCSCGVWENDLIKKDDEKEVEGSSSIVEDEEICICRNFSNECCHNLGRNRNTICKYSTSRCNKYDVESFNLDNLIKNNNNCYIDDNFAIEENDLNDDNNSYDLDELIKYCESSSMINLCDLCVNCEKNDTKDTENELSSINSKFHYNKLMKNYSRKLIERERGGAGKSDSKSTTMNNLSDRFICNCDCDLCELRNKLGKKPPCYENNYIDLDDDLLLNDATFLEIPEMNQVKIKK